MSNIDETDSPDLHGFFIIMNQNTNTEFFIRDAKIVTMNKHREVIQGDVLVRDDRIVAVGQIVGKPSNVFDASGMTLIPGLVQTHVHLCQALFRNAADDLSLLDWLRQRIWPLEAAHDPNSLRASARLGLAELIRGGTTTILDMGTVHHTDVIFEEIENSGIRAVSGKCLMDNCSETPHQLCQSSDECIRESERLAERWHGQGNGRIQYAVAPRFAISCSEGLLRQVAELANDKRLRIHTHAAENPDEVKLVLKKTGMRNVPYLGCVGLLGENVYLAHCIWLEEDELQLLADSQTRVLHCPSANLKLGSGIAKIPEMLARNISVSLGADGAPCNNNMDIFQEMRLAALIQKPRLGPLALPAKRVFEMATIKGAQALHLENEIGSIEAGKKADLVLIDNHQPHNCPADDVYAQIVYSTKSSDVRFVMVDGKTLFQNGELITLDAEKITREAEFQWQKIKERAKIQGS